MTKEERYEVFTEQFESNYEIEDYHGRWYYHGPAIKVDSWQEVEQIKEESQVAIQYDELGLGYIVYPY